MDQSSLTASQALPELVPYCWKGLDDVDIVPDEGVSPFSRQLLEGCIRRSFTLGQVTQLIQQGADPRSIGGLRVRGTTAAPTRRYSCLSFAIDSPTNIPSLSASGAYDMPYTQGRVPVVLPPWSSRQLQHDILKALIDGGADVNAGGQTNSPIQVAILAGNVTALEVIASHGADMTATDTFGQTPLHVAADHGFPWVLEWLCRQLTADDVNRGRPNRPNMTPLADAADGLYRHVFLQQFEQHVEGQYEWHSRRIEDYKTTIQTLLRFGAAASIARMPTATEGDRLSRGMVLTEYATVLSELSEVVMSAINGALAPQRDHSMLLARLLPLAPHHDGAHPHPSPSNMAFGPHEAEAVGWKIGAFLHEPPAAVAAIDEYLIADSVLRRRVRAAVNHFVKSAATRTSSNREVVGGMASVGGVMVRVPLQCFAVRDSGGQVVSMTGVREVVHRARLDEAAQYGVGGGVVKGFNEHLGDQDCQFAWGQVGHLSRTGLFVSLGID
ncbi:unnamed protein product [Vitrella brassicaformis CCMP3155]|uniref:Uncharacterized protein n=1 Tax=Vitrella brassicaformis (strain CCMP3155) TaxID=1169540 RepID=A0A0G4EJI4_VITBC|nr:unnamed protein product [Vitrella brassicaformis CCMP3155]|eukprot:CEL96689.1 unnamed protein product [Vitrella brassicaformis CCMP3155]